MSVRTQKESEEVKTYAFTPLYTTVTLEKAIRLEPKELNNKNIDAVLEYHIKRELGNKCTKDGYIKADSISIISRTIGTVKSLLLDGSVGYKVVFEADVCYPRQNDIWKCKVSKINRVGIMAEKKGAPLNISIPKQVQYNKKIYKKLKPDETGQEIVVQVIDARLEYNKRDLYVLCKLIDVLE